ncbi:hypothetical protein ASG11_03755 [Sphingomonas sp. Leaf357]|uniref:hypothetical protein n=1 Tax=Sphingomonas sp. Leaf357 TaxID=1736350 RepID=UPI0006F8810F|nr:hypothetical protein [Sphingomonas sp. Leaf357]KQS03485.1 hypothetical protein ASG11_03755 [Sphingomonas sp. Leaf357]
MTAVVPISPIKAVELVESAGILYARRVISDNAAAGLVKSYARVIETEPVAGGRDRVLGAAVPVDLWQRIIREGVVEDVWTGGTVRLPAADLIGGAPAVRITGIGFAAKHLHQTIEHHRGQVSTKPKAKTSVGQPVLCEIAASADAPAKARQSDPAAIPHGALTVTVNQAMAALGLGRTKINDMMIKGTLVRVKNDTRTLTTTESIRVLVVGGKA